MALDVQVEYKPYLPLLWQCDPVYPLGQTQRAYEEEGMHVPPFKQAGIQAAIMDIPQEHVMDQPPYAWP